MENLVARYCADLIHPHKNLKIEILMEIFVTMARTSYLCEDKCSSIRFMTLYWQGLSADFVLIMKGVYLSLIHPHPAETSKNSDNCDLLKVSDIWLALLSMEI